VLGEWRTVLNDINYYPIFDIARRIVMEIPPIISAKIMGLLARIAGQLISHGITASHDLYGRMFQRLITDRKFLATFYTLPESAMLLAEVAVDKLGIDFTDESAAPALRIATSLAAPALYWARPITRCWRVIVAPVMTMPTFTKR